MKRVSLLLIFIFASGVLSAQSVYEFLRMNYSPRAAALAGSYVANNDDPDVMFYNPAGLGALEKQPVSFSFVKHLLDINSASLTYSREFEGIGRFAAGVQYISYGSFTEADEFGNQTGEFGAGDFSFTLSYANILAENFFYGVNVKFIYSSIADYSSTGAAFDVGLQYVIPSSRWNFGFSIVNIGGQISSYVDTKEDIPLDMRLGFSKTLAHLPLTFYFQFSRLSDDYGNFGDRFSNFMLGAEIKISKVFALRFGFDNGKRKDMKVGTTAGFAGFNLGLGVNVSGYRVDYAFSSLGTIGSLHRFGVSTAF
jgi:hypothetical protein